MSSWSTIMGTITLDINGDTQPQSEYMLKEVLSHLPDVKGYSEWDEHHFSIFINQELNACNHSSSHDDRGISASYPGYNLENMNRFSTKNYRDGSKWIEKNDKFYLTIQGTFRRCDFYVTLKQFNNWLNRLAKNLWITDMCIRIQGYSFKDGSYKTIIIDDDSNCYRDMYEAKCFKYIYDSVE